jgi:hypothetical protein
MEQVFKYSGNHAMPFRYCKYITISGADWLIDNVINGTSIDFNLSVI